MNSENKILFWDHQIGPILIELIEKAQKEIIIVSPYVKMWTHLKEKLEYAKKRGVLTSLYYRLDENKENKIDIDELSPYFTYFIPIKNLHAKIYFIDDNVVVSSMNLYDYSQSSNKEIAILLQDQNQRNALREYLDTKLKPFAERIQRQTAKHEREKAPLKKKTNKRTNDYVEIIEEDFLEDLEDESGSCIRCGTEIDFDPCRPFCPKCYREWAKYENEDYKENYCHDCGETAKTSFAKPLCYECYKQS